MLKLLLCCFTFIVIGGLYCCLRVGAMYDREMEESEEEKGCGICQKNHQTNDTTSLF